MLLKNTRFRHGLLTLPLLMLPWVLGDRRVRFLLFAGSVMILGLALQSWTFPHYAAPATALLYALLLQAMRHLRVWRWRRRPVGFSLVRALPLICAAMLVVRISTPPIYALLVPWWPPSWCCTAPGNVHRARMLERLTRSEGRHLLIMRYGPRHNPHHEWVYNEADIDRAKVVWAREMDPTSNEALVRYFKGRRVWLLEVP